MLNAKIKFQKYSLAVGILILLIGLAVNAGWIFQIQRLYQLIPNTTPMQFNAALCFFMTGLGVIFLNSQFPKRIRILQFCSAWLILFGLLTLIQYVFEVNLGIDQLFFKPYLTLGTAFPGRMAPNSALCFLLAGLNLLLIRFKLKHPLGFFSSQLLSTLIGCLGLSSLAGYIFQFDGSYGWGNFSRMAPLTAFAFVLISISQGLCIFQFDRRTISKKRKIMPILGSLIVVIGTIVLWQSTLKVERKRIAEQVSLQASSYSQKIQSEIKERSQGLHRMASRWSVQNRTPYVSWKSDATNYLSDLVGMAAIGWVDKSSVIRWIEPYEKYKDLIGFQYFTEENRRSAIVKAYDKSEITMTKSIELLQGGLGFVIFVPIYANGKYDGLIQGVFRYKDFVNQILHFKGFIVRLTEGENIIYANGDTANALTRDWLTTVEMEINGVQWKMELLPDEETVRARTTYLPLIVLLVGSLLAFLVGILIELVQSANSSRQKLKVAFEAAQAATEAKSQFLANMSHEIRTPLNGVIGMSNLMMETPLTLEQKTYLDTILISADSLLNVIHDVLDFSKIEAGKMDLEEIDFSLPHAIEGVRRTLEFSAQQKGLKLQVEIADQIPRALKGDPSRLKQVLINLVSNSIKFTSEGSVLIRASYLESEIRIEVIDTGVGIPEKVLPSLFQAFTQADTTTTRRFGGTGLGLSISKKLVEMMGGRIGVQSEEGKGSVFWISIPFKVSDKKLIKSQIWSSNVPSNLIGARILLAEDNIVNQKIAKTMIEKMGFKVNAVASGIEVLKALQEISYELILMDCQMPEMDGFETTKKIRNQKEALYSQIPIVALTANALHGDREKCLEAGMNDYISKPMSPQTLEAVIVKNLNSR